MATVTLADMESKLLTLDQVTRKLSETEPLTSTRISNEVPVQFRVATDWVDVAKDADPTDAIGVEMRIDGKTQQMTKESFYQAAANFGLGSAYIKKIPADLTQGLLNYHYGTGMGDNAFSVLSVDDRVSAFARPSLDVYSNLRLLEEVVEGIQSRHGSNTPIFADYKFSNTLQRTDIRLITPALTRDMTGTNMDDVPSNGDDTWLSGIHLSSSTIGKSQTSLESYMFRWWCTNGATTTLDSVGKWDRRIGGDSDAEDVYEWARRSVDEVLGGMESQFDQVQALARLDVTGNTADVLREIFSQYQVPVSQRDAIMRRLLGMENITMYAIMAAITEAANEVGMDDRRRDRLMRIGGALPTRTFDTLKARVWREGHSADPEMANPYEPQLVR